MLPYGGTKVCIKILNNHVLFVSDASSGYIIQIFPAILPLAAKTPTQEKRLFFSQC